MEASSQFHAQATSTPGTHLTGSCVGPISDLHALEKWKISCRNSKGDPSVVQPVAQSLYWLSYPSSISVYETTDVAQELGSHISGVIREWYEDF